jgi:ribose transport system ATP-binding protein
MLGENYSLEMLNISKAFGGIKALDDVSFRVCPGEVHCLVGENGAGKSTLMKILAGAYKKDSGHIKIFGQEVDIKGPSHSQELGIGIVYQERSLVPTLSVAENIMLGRFPMLSRIGAVDFAELRRRAAEPLHRLGFKVDLSVTVSSLSTAQQQMIEIAKALSRGARILILDEPSAYLTPKELDRLFEIMNHLRKQGVSLIYISHRLQEVFQIGDRATVLKDGRVVNTVNVGDVGRFDLIRMMVGRESGKHYPPRATSIGDEVLRLDRVQPRGFPEPISLSLRKGEILGISGLVGAGRTELMRAIFGADRLVSGQIHVDGVPVSVKSPQAAVRSGLALVPEDRRDFGLVLGMPVKDNLSMVVLRQVANRGFIRAAEEKELADRMIRSLSIKTSSPMQETRNLSGGNQQKVVLGKWLATTCKVLILDEPTRGIDVGAKEEIHLLMRRLTAQGLGIIMVSSELPEIIGMSDRVMVMRDKRMVAEVDAASATEEQIIAYAVIGGE